jgi:predicted PurR-regulated permease PerM
LIVGASALATWLLVPPLGRQLGDLADQFQPSLANLRAKVDETRFGKFLLSQSPTLNEMLSGQGNVVGRLTGFLTRTINVIVTVLVVVFTAMFLAIDPHTYIRGTLRLVPKGYRERAGEVMGAIGYTLKWWLIGQGVAMVVIGVATWLGLWIIGVKLALALGFLAAVFNFIPNFGPLFSAIPATLIALMDSPEKAFAVIILFIVLQNAEGYLVSPNIQRKAVDLPQAISIVAQILMGVLAGAIGFVLATPLAAVLHVAVKTLYVEDLLGDDVDTPADEPNLEEIREVKAAAEEMEKSG